MVNLAMKENWNPRRCQLLLTLLSNSTNLDFQHQLLLFETLDKEKHYLTELLFLPSKDPSKRKEVQEGRFYSGDNALQLKTASISKILALSDELDIDEFLAAEIYTNVVYQEAASKDNLMYTALLQFYRERFCRLKSLELILHYGKENSGHSCQPQLKEFSISLLRLNSSDSSALPKKILECLGNNYDLDSKVKEFCPSISTYLPKHSPCEINRLRIKEVQSLGKIYFSLYQNNLCSNSDVLLLIDILSQANVYNTIFVHLLLSLLVYLNNLTEHSFHRKHIDETWITTLKKEIYKDTWHIFPSQGLVGLFLGPLLHFIADGQRGQNTYLSGLKSAEDFVSKSLESGSLQFAVNFMFSLRDRSKALSQPIRAAGEYVCLEDNVELDFFNLKPEASSLIKVDLYDAELYSQMIDCFDYFLRKFSSRFGQFLQSLHKKEEEQLLYHPSETEPSNLLGQTESYSEHNYQRIHHDKQKPFFTTESLYALISIVYNHRPDYDCHFLDEKQTLLNFLKTALSSRAHRFQIAALDMVGALSYEPHYADWVFSLFTGSGPTDFFFSWPRLFDYLTKSAQDGYSVSNSQGTLNSSNLSESEFNSLKAYLRLFSRVFGHSLKARSSNGVGLGSSLLQPMFVLLMCPVPTNIKGLVLEAISSIAVPIKEPSLSIQIWQAIEEINIISVIKSPNEKGNQTILNEFEIEKGLELYDQTISFLRLLNNLIYLPSVKSLTCKTIPHDLGASYRVPGISPYIAFMSKNIFIPSFDRTYRNSYQKWEILDLCMNIIDKCLSDFLALSQLRPLKLHELSIHPGFESIINVLQGSSMLDCMLKILDFGLGDMENYPSCLYPSRENTTFLTLKVLNTIINLQEFFINDINPQVYTLLCTERQIPSPSSLSYLDQLLLCRSKSTTLVSIASYICCNSNSQIAILSTKLLNSLCSRKSFPLSIINNMNPLLQTILDSEEASSIVSWYYDKLSFASLYDLESVFHDKVVSEKLVLSILDVIIKGLNSGVAYSFGHFLLGFYEQADNLNTCPQFGPSLDKATPFHSIFSLVTSNIENQASFTNRLMQPFLFYDSQVLSKCYQIFCHLCINEATSISTLQFLSSQYNFASTHLSFLPTVPNLDPVGDVSVVSKKISSKYHEVNSHLEICSSLLEIAACELNNTKDYTSKVPNLLSLLFESESATANLHNPLFSGSQLLSTLRIMGFLDIAIAKWEPRFSAINPHGHDHSFIQSNFDVTTCSSRNKFGEVTYDLSSIQQLIDCTLPDCDPDILQSYLAHYRALNSVTHILHNQRRLVLSWRDLILASTNDIFENTINLDHEPILLELLICLLFKIENNAHDLERVLDILGQVIFHLVTKLNTLAISPQILNLTGERVRLFHDKILLSWDACIRVLNQAGGHSTLRYFLYQSIKSFLDYVKSFGVNSLFSGSLVGSQPNNLSLSGFGLELVIGYLGADSIGTIPDLKLEALRLLAYLAPLLCLPSSHENAPGSYIVSLLPSKCDLKSMVDALKEEIQGLSVLSDHHLFSPIFQSRIEFFICMAQSPFGAAQLIDLNFFEVVNFTNILGSQLDASTPASEALIDTDSSFFIIEPLLRLFVAIIVNSNDRISESGKQASKTLLQNPELFSSILRETKRSPSLRSLKLLNHVTSFIFQLTLQCRSFSLNDVSLVSYYHFQMISIISAFSDHKKWLKKLMPHYQEEKETNLVPADVLTPGTTKFYREAELTASSILFNTLAYCQLVYCEGVHIVPLESPLGFQYQILSHSTPSSLIQFSSRATIGDINIIIKQVISKIEKQFNDIIKLAKIVETSGSIPVDLVDKLFPDKKSKFSDDVRLFHRQNKSLISLQELLLSKKNYIQLFIGLVEVSTTILYRQLDLICDEHSPFSPFAINALIHNQMLEKESQLFTSQLKSEVHPTLNELSSLMKRKELTEIVDPHKVDYILKISQFTQELTLS